MRPSLPLAGIELASRLLSFINLRTAGEVLGLSLGAAVFAVCSDFAGAGAAASFLGSSFFAGAALSLATAPSSNSPKIAPTSTLSPSPTAILTITPSAGALTSNVTLSVSSSTIGSSAFTASPSFLSHCATVASATDSPSVGTTICVIISSFFQIIFSPLIYALNIAQKQGQ